jgi:hypothetical protein
VVGSGVVESEPDEFGRLAFFLDKKNQDDSMAGYCMSHLYANRQKGAKWKLASRKLRGSRFATHAYRRLTDNQFITLLTCLHVRRQPGLNITIPTPHHRSRAWDRLELL